MNEGDRVYPNLNVSIRDLHYDTMCGNDHVWVKCRAPSNADECVACDRCGVLSQHMKAQFQEEGEKEFVM